MSKYNSGFGGVAIFVIWLVALVSFYNFVQSAFGFSETVELGIPFPLAVVRIVLLGGFLGSLIAILTGREWGLWTLFATTIARIPFGVAFNHYYSIDNEPNHILTNRWIITTTFWNTVFWLIILGVLIWAIRNRADAFGSVAT